MTIGAQACVFQRAPKLPNTIPAVETKSGIAFALRSAEIRVGSGAAMEPRKCAYAHYTGWLTDGTKFDSSRDTMPNGQPRSPIAFAQGARRVISGWDLGFEGMRVGGQRRLFIPYQLAYGENGRPPTIPAKAELIFDVELMAVADTLPRAEPTPRGQPAPPPQCPTWAAVGGSARSSGSGQGQQSAPRVQAFTGFTLMDGTERAPIAYAAMIVRNGRVVAAGSASSGAIPAGAERVDLGGTFVTTGLVNAHGHINVPSGNLIER